MKTTGILIILFTLITATAIASPNALPIGVEVIKRDGKTIVREVIRYLSLIYIVGFISETNILS
jgi:hypothetical protein